ncbi:MAG TPA: endonuclease [Spirochaetota bacterium]|nr:endonuclease [Spirochaetota bacterium]HPJ41320.1 endonuclease [Spirochaetota bacterium]HPR37055.1 endonuclease [Spirochaetota bacterium]HRX46671.1 endonuclease [Spirochaetota bacterium]
MEEDLNSIYKILLKAYGKQGWWPIADISSGKSEYGINAPGDEADIFEIVIGSILTQNVAWVNVEKALLSLKKKRLLDPLKLYKAKHDVIARCIIPSGYYNQKTKKIKNFLSWFKGYGFSFEPLMSVKTESLRRELLGINGIGPETADSILLYGLRRKVFVVDAYTRRIFSRLGLISFNDSYESVRELFQKKTSGGFAKYNEYHALIVIHGKDVCKKKALCDSCCLGNICPSFKEFF